MHDLKLHPVTPLCLKSPVLKRTLCGSKYCKLKYEKPDLVSSQHKDGPESIKSHFIDGIMVFCDWIAIRKFFSAYVYSQVDIVFLVPLLVADCTVKVFSGCHKKNSKIVKKK